MKQIIRSFLLFFTLATAAFCQPAPRIDPALEKELREMIRLTGADKLGLQMGEQMMQQLEEHASTQMPKDFRDRLLAKFTSGKLVELVLPIYARHLSLEDVRAMNEFYRSPAGRKVISIMPQLMKESMEAGVAWGQGIAQEILVEMKAQGYIPKDA